MRHLARRLLPATCDRSRGDDKEKSKALLIEVWSAHVDISTNSTALANRPRAKEVIVQIAISPLRSG